MSSGDIDSDGNVTPCARCLGSGIAVNKSETYFCLCPVGINQRRLKQAQDRRQEKIRQAILDNDAKRKEREP